jgi:hypothetical protein
LLALKYELAAHHMQMQLITGRELQLLSHASWNNQPALLTENDSGTQQKWATPELAVPRLL